MKKTLYPLTSAQQTIMYSLKFLPSVYANIPFEFEFTSYVDKDILIQAIALSTKRNQNNYTRIVKSGKDLKQYFSDEPLNPIEYIEFDNENEYEKSLSNFGRKPFPNKSIETQLIRIRVVKKPNNNIAINGCFSHLIYDAYSIMSAFKDVCEIYKSLVHGTTIEEIEVSPIKAFEMDYSYQESNRKKIDEEYYDSKVFNTEPQYTCINGKSYKGHVKGKRYGKHRISLKMAGGLIDLPFEKNFIDSVNSYSTNNNLTSQTLFLLACRSFLAKANDTDDVMIWAATQRRPTIVQKKAGGTMADAVHLRTIIKDDITFKKALENMHSSEMETYMHAMLGSTQVIELINKKYKVPLGKTYSDFCFTYQPSMYLDDELKYKIRHLSNGKEITNIYISIMPCDSDMNYVANYTYQADFVSKEKIVEFHNFIISFIKAGIENDSLSIKEIIERVMR